MKKSNKCPKCGGSEIYSDESFSQRGASSQIGISNWSRISVTTYACMNCGFAEKYIDNNDMNNESKMDKIRSNWKKQG
ncbi:MAG: putative nucleic-acid-binding Zn-ribbon protein [Crocinitomix sp.]|jgi:predicted nucleic-acid-binding Zn-ribbon protein